MEEFRLTTPVLYLVFNRPGYVKKTFPEIRKAKPMQLFIGADGPRNSEEKKKTDAVRKYILENIDWKCDVKTLFRKENLGCKHAVSGAINWFFKNVEQGIILEDDCLPDQSFFRFCQELLAKYENSKQVMQINGTNFSRSYFSPKSYYFSKYSHIWGWATWKRAWEGYDSKMLELNKEEIKKQYPSKIEGKLISKRLKDIIGNADTWDYQWIWKLRKEGICISPKQNMVENIGFSDKTSSHTSRNFWDNLFIVKKTRATVFPLKHPKKIRPSFYLDKKELYSDLTRVVLKRLF